MVGQKRYLLFSIKLSRHITGAAYTLHHILLWVNRSMSDRIRIRNLLLILLFINGLIDRDFLRPALSLRLLVHTAWDLWVLREGLDEDCLGDSHFDLWLARAILHMLRVMLIEASTRRIYRCLLHWSLYRLLLITITGISLLCVPMLAWTCNHLSLKELDFVLKSHDFYMHLIESLAVRHTFRMICRQHLVVIPAKAKIISHLIPRI